MDKPIVVFPLSYHRRVGRVKQSANSPDRSRVDTEDNEVTASHIRACVDPGSRLMGPLSAGIMIESGQTKWVKGPPFATPSIHVGWHGLVCRRRPIS